MLRLPLPALLCVLYAALSPAADLRAPFIVNYDAHVDGGELALHKTAILAPEASIANREAPAAAGTRILGYISVGELAAEQAGNPAVARITMLGKNGAWNSALPDLTDPRWSDWIVEHCAAKVADRGWQGFFLDTLDSARLPDGLSESTYLAREKAVAEILTRLRAKYPAMRIVANRGFASLRQAPAAIDGVLVEGVLSTYRDGGRFGRIPAEDTLQLRAELDRWRAAGKQVLALDYTASDDHAEARNLYRELTAFGYEAAVARPDLMQGAALAPIRRVPNRAVVLYGSNIGEGLVEHPVHTRTRTTLMHPLMWRGYNVEFINVYHQGFPADLSHYDLVILEPFEPNAQFDINAAATMLASRLRSPLKTIFLTGMSPWNSHTEAWAKLSAATGWTGSGQAQVPVSTPTVVLGDKALLNAESKSPPPPRETLCDLIAPAQAQVLIRQCTSRMAMVRRFDSAFSAPFGGVLLAPWINESDPIGRIKTRVDFFTYLDRVLGPSAPVFDTTTRTGSRLFFAHVDGDGLHGMSKVELGKRAGEVMRDRIFKAYAIPFTSSVITAEILGHTMPRVDKAEISRRHDIARSIFALPNVEIASHSYSHPFAWTTDSVTAAGYGKARLTLLPEFNRPLDYHQETLGSIDYINRHLSPAGKACRLMLWTGNCLPPPEAITLLDTVGMPNLNGIASSSTRDNPYLASIMGGNLIHRGVIQVGAPFENDNVYYDMDNDGLEGGFSRVTEAFEITGAPRRLLPVNAYWHFYSADTLERLRALKRVLDWATARPLHPIPASEYAAMMRDLPTGIGYEDTRGGHLFFMPRGCLTIRYPDCIHIDMRQSAGVLGYRQELGVTYVHTDGTQAVRIVPCRADDGRPKLVYSTRPVTIARAPNAWTVTFAGFSPGRAKFTGLTPRASVRTAGGTHPVDATGMLEMDAHPGESVVLPLGAPAS